jgi:hypothetical protein
MTARRVAARRLFFQLLLFLPAGIASSSAIPGCYAGGGGTDPPQESLYFPTGLAVSKGGNALYAVNSDFDLQWNGGTLQSYDLFLLRRDVNALILANLAPSGTRPIDIQCGNAISAAGVPCIPVLNQTWNPADCNAASSTDTSAILQSNGSRNSLNETCAPPVASSHYERSSATIGAFATQLQLTTVLTNNGRRRLFAPVSGNTSLTWADVPNDTLAIAPASDLPPPGIATFQPNDLTNSPFMVNCGADSSGRCGASNEAGNTIGDPRNTRNVTLPGEPFAMALTLDDSAVALTQQSTNQASVLLSGLAPNSVTVDSFSANAGAGVAGPNPAAGVPSPSPSMQFVLDGVPPGGDGIATVPHDESPDSPAPGCEFFPPAERPSACVRPSFLLTNHTTAEIDLLRYYDDFGASVVRPFLEREVAYPLTPLAGGTDSRGIVVDPTPRMQCRQAVSAAFQASTAPRTGVAPVLQGSLSPADIAAAEAPVDPCPSDPGGDACQQWIACGTVPSRVFFASRTPPALVVGAIGGPSVSGDGTFDPDRLTIGTPVPLAAGPSTVYLAPIVNRVGRYELRVFVVCFDSNTIFVYNPAFAGSANPEDGIENVINVGVGPFAMAFDPFDMRAVAQNAVVVPDSRQTDPAHLKVYRFAYVALFTNSYLQVIDLDDSLTDVSARTFENVVFTLGQPTAPKGT